MPNQPIAELIANRLGTLSTTDETGAEIAIPIIGYRTTGLTPEQAEPITTNAKLVGQAIIHLIETDGASTIIPTRELTKLRAQATPQADKYIQLKLACNQCHNTIALPVLNLDNPTTNLQYLLETWANINPACPHNVNTP